MVDGDFIAVKTYEGNEVGIMFDHRFHGNYHELDTDNPYFLKIVRKGQVIYERKE